MEKFSITISRRYLILPINGHTKRKNVFLCDGDTLLWDFNAPIDFLTPTHHTYLDVTHLMGRNLTVTTVPAMDVHFEFCDELPADVGANQPYRPMVHFTARYGWINDPNGLVYVDGHYHMFFQHNPADSAWGNMTWGHAVSDDLLHWTQLGCALVPDETGPMFSGSAIVDGRNVSGLGTEETPPVLFYYTAAGDSSHLSAGKKAIQCLAYSTDGGMTLHKYEGNPVLGHVLGGNRDPKVVWCAELNAYLLALYLDGHDYALFTSNDLLSFRELQRLTLPGDAECPDIYPLEVENEPGNVKWVFSGATDNYIVGEFSDGRFTVVQEAKPYSHSQGRLSYAAQTFSHTEGRRVKIAWERFHAPEACFNGQMSIPTEVSLCRRGEMYYLRTIPCREFFSLYERSTNYIIRKSGTDIPLDRHAYDLTLTMSKTAPDVAVRFFGYDIFLCPSDNKLVFDGEAMPLSHIGESVHLRIISDVLGCEIFADHGLIYSVCAHPADYNLRYLTVTSLNSVESPQLDLTVTELKTIWYN